MLILLGVIIGIVISILVFVILMFFKVPIEEKIRVMGIDIGRAGPKPKGAVFEVQDEGDEIREEYLAKAKAEGRDVKLSELR